MSNSSPDLTVVMPAYNERATIESILARVDAVPIEKEILVVDDYSQDGTREKLLEIEAGWTAAKHPLSRLRVLLMPENGGKGRALRTGFAQARGRVTIVQDADLEYDPNDYPALVNPILSGEAEVVYGSRWAGASLRTKLSGHTLGNRVLTLASNLFTHLSLTDMETCYKAIRTDILQSLELHEDRFGIEPELTAKLAKRGHRPLEVPISYDARGWSDGKKIGWRDGVEAFRVIWANR